MKKTLRTLAASVLVCAAALFTFAACSDDEKTDDGTVAVTGVTISPSTVPTLEVGGTFTLTPTVKPDNATNKAVTWSSSPGGIVTVSDAGLVTAVASGATNITVTTVDGGKTNSVAVTVEAVLVPALEVSPASLPDVPAAGESYEVAVTSNVGWTVAVDPADAWCTVDPVSGSSNGAVTVTVQPTDIFNQRTATVTFTYGSALTKTVSVTQAAGVPSVLSPEAGADIILSKELNGNITFSWLADATSYEVIVAKDAALNEEVYSESGISGTSHAVTEAAIQTLLESTQGLKRYYKNPLYWGVKADGEFIGEARGLTLSGRRIFADERDGKTYEVAVIDNDYYKGIWMAEDLRSRKYGDGTDLPDGFVKELPDDPAPEWNLTGGVKLAPNQNPRVGYFYKAAWDVLLTNDAKTLAPTGWKEPVVADWVALYAAAAQDPEEWDVVLCPDAYQDPSYGAWGLHLSAAGFYDGDPFNSDLNGLHYATHTSDGVGWAVCYDFYFPGYEYNGNGAWRTGRIRLIYTADE
jgi:uncharacterized protein (TIGR02145 family)